MEVLVLGPDRPCLRCKMTLKLAEEVARELEAEIMVRRVSISTEEAKKYGKVGSAHDVADAANMNFDSEKLGRLARGGDDLSQVDEDYISKVDKEFMAYKEKAEEIGYLVTPVLLVNGQVKSMGVVPKKEKIREWVQSELR